LPYYGYPAESNTILRIMEERIKVARKALGWSQADLARRMFVTQPSVADWESGRKAPHTKNLARLSVMLGVSFEWLSTGRGEMHSSTPNAQEFSTDDWILPEERSLLNTYSRLKPKQRSALLGFLESLE
jgi:transcriptional regulator with XRE-family HTH domain